MSVLFSFGLLSMTVDVCLHYVKKLGVSVDVMKVDYLRHNYCCKCRMRFEKVNQFCPICGCKLRTRPFVKKRAAEVWRREG